jgi:hypothetical protein
MQANNIILPRHYPRQHQFEMRLLFQRIISNICSKTRSNYPESLKYYIYTNKYDIEQEKNLVNDNEVRMFLDKLSREKDAKFVFQVFRPGKLFLYIQSSSSQDDTFNNILKFIFQLLMEMQNIGELSDNLTDSDIEMLSIEINELILQK